MAVLKATVSLYRAGEEKPIADKRPHITIIIQITIIHEKNYPIRIG